MIYVLLAFGLLFIDLITKALADAFSVHFVVIPGFLNINIIYNKGAAFSFLAGKPWAQYLFMGLAVVMSVVLIILLIKTPKHKKFLRISFVFLLAGAVGNLVDRVFLGYVRDFVDFPWFANCNIADFYITAGVIMLFIQLLFLDEEAFFKRRETVKEENTEEEEK